MIRDPRRRRRLNRALHELRRPLQALILLAGEGYGTRAPSEPRADLVRMVAAALADLDREINGGAAAPATRAASGRELVRAAAERWRERAGGAAALRVAWSAGAAPVEVDPARIGQALDNLFANAIEHGSPPVLVSGTIRASSLRVTICDAGRGGTQAQVGLVPRLLVRRGDRDPRRGHGLGIVHAVARAHGGRFAIACSPRGTVAALELPLHPAFSDEQAGSAAMAVPARAAA